MFPYGSVQASQRQTEADTNFRYGHQMRWDHLFADLEAQLDELERDELTSEVIDRTQREKALIRLADRIRAADGKAIDVRLLGGERVSGQVHAVGADWLTLSVGQAAVGQAAVGQAAVGQGAVGQVAVVPLAAVVTARGLPSRGVAPESAVVARLDLGYALRLLMREGVSVLVSFVDGEHLKATIATVGADYVELAPDGEGTRVMAPFGNLAVIRSHG